MRTSGLTNLLFLGNCSVGSEVGGLVVYLF